MRWYSPATRSSLGNETSLTLAKGGYIIGEGPRNQLMRHLYHCYGVTISLLNEPEISNLYCCLGLDTFFDFIRTRQVIAYVFIDFIRPIL